MKLLWRTFPAARTTVLSRAGSSRLPLRSLATRLCAMCRGLTSPPLVPHGTPAPAGFAPALSQLSTTLYITFSMHLKLIR